MISLKNVSKQYSGQNVVSGISLKIEPGEIVGLLGPNGAGKTTTIRMMAGVLPPTSGSLTIDNKSFETHEHLLKQRIGYLPEENPIYEELTVEEHLHFWSRVKGVLPQDEKEMIHTAVESTGIGSVYYRFIGELSKGYRQRVGLAQAILGRPDILLLDEPTEGLDPNQRKDIQKLLSMLGKSRTVIVSSHVLSEISKLASRIIIIHNGRVVGDDSPDKLIASTGNSSGQQLNVEIRGNLVLKTLKSLPSVTGVSKLSTNNYQVMAKKNLDIREEVFKLAVKNKWILLGMRQVERELEDVFTELTTG